MAQTLAQALLLTQNPLLAGVISTIVESSPVLDRLPFMDVAGNAYAYNKELALPGVEFRAVNAAYTESTGTVANASESLVILGGDADVDRFLQQTGGNLADLRQMQTTMKTKAARLKFQGAFFNGDTAVDANSFDGLKKRLTGAQVIVAGTNGIPVNGTTEAERLAFLDKLDAGIAAVPGITPQNGAIYMAAGAQSKYRSAQRSLKMNTTPIESYGKSVMEYNGIPILDPGNNADGTPILPFTETTGTSAVTSSIYIVKFGEDPSDGGVTGIQNGGLEVTDLGELQTKPVWRTRIEWYLGLALFSGQAAARITGILNS